VLTCVKISPQCFYITLSQDCCHLLDGSTYTKCMLSYMLFAPLRRDEREKEREGVPGVRFINSYTTTNVFSGKILLVFKVFALVHSTF
jgi:hypothetical protein